MSLERLFYDVQGCISVIKPFSPLRPHYLHFIQLKGNIRHFPKGELIGFYNTIIDQARRLTHRSTKDEVKKEAEDLPQNQGQGRVVFVEVRLGGEIEESEEEPIYSV